MSQSPENASDVAPTLLTKRNSRKSHRKSRNGCEDCKRRRIKCDEQRPACSNCRKHSASCSFLRHVLPFPNPNPPSLGPSPQLAHLLNQPVSPPQSSKPAVFPDRNGTVSVTQPLAISNLIVPTILPSPFNDLAATLLDFELQHNYDTATSYSIATSATLQSFLRLDVPKIAFSHPFLLHGILGISALHLAYCKRELRGNSSNRAQYHYDTGFRIAAPLLSRPNGDSYAALYLFSTFATMFVFGEGPKPGDFLLFGDHDPTEGQVLFRETRTLIESNPGIFENGDLSPLISTHARQALQPPSSTRNQHLEALRQSIVNSMTTFADVRIYLEALEMLSRSFPPDYTSGSRASQITPHSVFNWLYRLSDEFLQCLKRRDPIALVVFAHFCVLLNDLGSLWYLDGWVSHLLSEIYRSLDAERRVWIRWPMAEIGWIPGV